MNSKFEEISNNIMKNRKRTIILFLTFLYTASLQLTANNKHKQVYDAVVDINETGDYVSIQKAIDEMPENRNEPWLIFVKDGVYEEWIHIPKSKRFLHLIGQNRDNVIITYNIHCGSKNDKDWEFSANNPKNKGRYPYGSVVVSEAPDFYAENISFINKYGVENQSGPQALAMRTDGDRYSFYNCAFRGFQDTWRTSTIEVNDRHYARSCWIEGAVDYIYGSGDVLFEDCTLYNVRSGSVIVAPAHKPETEWGYVFKNCTIDGNEKAADGKQLLGRPWHNSPIAVFINTKMNIDIAPKGWIDMGGLPALFAEYNSVDRDDVAIDLSKRKRAYKATIKEEVKETECKSEITEEDIKKYTYKNIVSGVDNWNPRQYMEKLSAPVKLTLVENTLSWIAVPEAIGYVIILDSKVIGFTTTNTFSVKVKISNKNVCQIQAVGKYGNLGYISVLL